MRTRNPFLFLLALVAGIALPACSSGLGTMAAGRGPGATCDPCSDVEAAPAVPPGQAGEVAQAAAAARSGQDASSQPVQTDPARIQPTVVWNRGSGPNVNAPASAENRSQAGAPAVNQGLVFPASAMASVDSPNARVLGTLQATLDRLMDAWTAEKDPVLKAQLWASVDSTMNRLAQAGSMGGAGQTSNYYFDGARIVQVVANGSKSGDGAGTAIDPSNAKNIGEATADMVRGVVTGEDPAELRRGRDAAAGLPLTPAPPPAPAPAPGTPTPAEGGPR